MRNNTSISMSARGNDVTVKYEGKGKELVVLLAMGNAKVLLGVAKPGADRAAALDGYCDLLRTLVAMYEEKADE